MIEEQKPWISSSDQIADSEVQAGSPTRIDSSGKTITKFTSRAEIEEKIMFGLYKDIPLEGIWNDKHEIRVYRLMLFDMRKCADNIAMIMAILFPGDLFFLYHINLDNIATAAARINDILFNQIYPQAFDIVCQACHLETDEDRAKLERQITTQDFMELFTIIIEENLSNEMVKAITKKLQRLLGERFNLENAFPNISELTEEILMRFLNQSPMNNLVSSGSTPMSMNQNEN